MEVLARHCLNGLTVYDDSSGVEGVLSEGVKIFVRSFGAKNLTN